MSTLASLIDRHGVDVDAHLDRDASVPTLTGVQAQGDVLVVPSPVSATTPVPPDGVPVVRGEAGGNTHLLLADGDVRCDLSDGVSATSLTLAHVTVSDGAVGWLAHPEHGYLGVGPGSYELRRQREQADVIRVVAD